MTSTGPDRGIEGRRKRRLRCRRCSSVRPAKRRENRYHLQRPIHWQGARAVEWEHDHMQPLLQRAPALTLVTRSSAPEPPLALGVNFPEPPSPREHILPPGTPCRAPPICCQKSRRRDTAHHAAASNLCTSTAHSDSPPQAPLMVRTTHERRTCSNMRTEVSSELTSLQKAQQSSVQHSKKAAVVEHSGRQAQGGSTGYEGEMRGFTVPNAG